MRAETTAEVVSTLEQATTELQEMTRILEREIGSVASAFEGLAADTDAILSLAAAIVGCVENESVSDILPKVQTLGAAAGHFIAERLHATTGTLQTVTHEVNLLRQLSEVAGRQESVALEIKTLSVLTNIEVAHLGSVGTRFHYLAQELADFSKSVIHDCRELATHINGRRIVIEDVRFVLSAELPRLREALARTESDLRNALTLVECNLTQLSLTPAQFRTCVEDIARQINGVVSAVQAHDITRQQIEHVQEAFTMIAACMRGDSQAGRDVPLELPCAYAGLTIQIYQLRTIKEIVSGWASQIRDCMGGILRVSTSEVLGIAPLVLDQEQKVLSQLARIEQLEREGEAYSERIRRTLGGLSHLMQLVTEHLSRSKSIRDRLRMLAFNSIIEASHLGTEANVILAISTSIKEISLSWSHITDQSDLATQEIVKLVEQTNTAMEAFSEVSNQQLHKAQTQTQIGLDNLRNAAEFAARQAQEMKSVTERMQLKVAHVGDAGDLLDACFGRFDALLSGIEDARHEMEINLPEAMHRYDAAEMERLFSASYTTELERDVLRAALRGGALPLAHPTLGGNSVELF